MKKSLLAVLAVCMITCAPRDTPQTQQTISVVPKPVSANIIPGKAVLWPNDLQVTARSEEEKGVASMLQSMLTCPNIKVSVIEAAPAGNNRVALQIASDSTLGQEGYRLSVDDSGVTITANTGAGLFYGCQTLAQMAGPDCKPIPYAEVTDYPRFGYRGLHLDVARHMFPAEFVKKYIDLMARHKLNRFHWHLTEDQGWRIEIKKYPRLQEVAAFRKETVIGRQSTRTRATATYDGKRYGGFYTQDEIRDIVKYASDRFVTIIPEIELPGHASAALAAYPELGCTGGPYEVATSWGVFKDVYCGGKEEPFVFLQDVLDEVITLFPGKYIHIGGDECPKDSWKVCPNCQKRIKTEKLGDEHGLQSYFVQRIEKYLNGKGRQIIGWDEILEGGLAPNATVMSWRGEEGGVAAARQNHDVIMTPESWVYLDYAQDTAANEPLSIGNFLPVRKVYEYEPVPAALSEAESRRILGVQANLWTEYVPDSRHAEYMAYPRASALSEVAWSPGSRNYDEFVQRMKEHVKRLEAWDVNYAKHIEKEFK